MERKIQFIGLALNLVGTILLAIGALDNSPPTWGGIQNRSNKSKFINTLTWLGLLLAFIAFIIQIYFLKIS